ncbi:hypothetical protein [Desulfosporosinus sp. FKA]|uniref:hypothetical protein n=1 Tax=Desulfosporosinus sp. FKA TaxID=1969834 RepID=UPI000B4A29C2|nr:hypothetical protein [Desulfosporosinus sp. FKA]
MGQLIYYSTITGLCTFSVEAIILISSFETIDSIILNGGKKRFVDFVRVMILVFGISLVLYLGRDSRMENIYAYGFTFVMGLLLTIAMYLIAMWIMSNISLGKNYFIEDEEYGKLYLIKNSDERFIFITKKYMLLADQPKVTDSKIVLLKGQLDIKQKKLHSEPKKLTLSYKEAA